MLSYSRIPLCYIIKTCLNFLVGGSTAAVCIIVHFSYFHRVLDITSTYRLILRILYKLSALRTVFNAQQHKMMKST